MLRTLHGKLSLLLFVLLCLVGVVSVALSSVTTHRYIEEVNQRLNRPLAEALARHLQQKQLLPADLRYSSHLRARAGDEISYLMVLNPDIEIYILDTKGRIVLYSWAPGRVQLEQVDLAPIRQFESSLVPLPIFGDDPRHPQERKTFSVAPIPGGSVYIILGGQGYDSVAGQVEKSYILRRSLWATGAVLLLVFVLGLVFFFLLTRRLRWLTHRVEEFQRVRLQEAKIEDNNPSSDEIERLNRVYDAMSLRLVQQARERESAEAYRRELISNVSHDLRTPLAALRGYLETLMMKRGQLAEEEESRYLSVAAKHATRLEKLVVELFELAKLDSPEAAPQLEAFSLPELVQDVLQQYQLNAQKRGIALEAVCDTSLPFVKADIGLIERALENPLENAIRYTPDGGKVRVRLEPLEQAIVIHIVDSGMGIEPEDLPRIFERSFRAAKHRSAPGEGGGLGLAITKRILELHGGSVTAQSEPGQGTTISLYLPLNPELDAPKENFLSQKNDILVKGT